jgi:DNA-binding CsgD family transcriptional regulator
MTMHRWVMSQLHDITGKTVRHLCNNKRCFRYDHLALGTQADNMRDMIEQGRHARWGRNYKLSAKDVERIHELRKEGRTYQSIADEYGVGETTVFNAVNNRTKRKR